jgi:acetolactate synthase-1/2/3 large subunit
MSTSAGLQTRPVHQAITDGLAANGVTAAFGLMGEDTANLITDLERVGIEYYAARHENVAVNMADGYAAMTGLGVAILSRGPGITNAATALATAARRRSPVLVISGEMPAGPGAFAGAMKRVDHGGLCHSLGLEYVGVPAADALTKSFAAALEHVRAGRPTLLAIPVDILFGKTADEPGVVPAAPPHDAGAPPALDGAALQQVLDVLGSARRPFILAGRGAALAGAREHLEALAERTGALLGTTMQAKDLFRGSPLDVGVVGGFANPVARGLLREVDCALVFGASLSQFTTATGRIFKGVPIVQFDLEPKPPVTGPPVQLQLRADAAAAAAQLLQALKPVSGPLHSADTLGRVARCHRFEEDDVSRPDAIDPRLVAATLDELLPRERMILTDGGHCMGFPAMHMRVPTAGHYLLYDGIGAVGMGIGTAMGTAVARPDSPMLFFAGDGGLTMTLGDLETAARHRIPLFVCVFDDGAYGAERHFLDLEGQPNHRSIFGNVDFAAVARGVGMEAATVRTIDDLRELAPVLADAGRRPFLIDCKIVGELRSTWMEEFSPPGD